MKFFVKSRSIMGSRVLHTTRVIIYILQQEGEDAMNASNVIAAYFAFLKDEALAATEVRIDAGSAMVLMGLRDSTTDLDVTVSSTTFDKIVARRGLSVNASSNGIPLASYSPAVDLMATSEPFANIFLIDGVHCAAPRQVLVMKQALNREKDQKDIKLLTDALRQDINQLFGRVVRRSSC